MNERSPQELETIDALLTAGPGTSDEVAEDLGLSRRTAGMRLARMTRRGVLKVIGEYRPLGRGRPSKIYGVNDA